MSRSKISTRALTARQAGRVNVGRWTGERQFGLSSFLVIWQQSRYIPLLAAQKEFIGTSRPQVTIFTVHVRLRLLCLFCLGSLPRLLLEQSWEFGHQQLRLLHPAKITEGDVRVSSQGFVAVIYQSVVSAFVQPLTPTSDGIRHTRSDTRAPGNRQQNYESTSKRDEKRREKTRL